MIFRKEGQCEKRINSIYFCELGTEGGLGYWDLGHEYIFLLSHLWLIGSILIMLKIPNTQYLMTNITINELDSAKSATEFWIIQHVIIMEYTWLHWAGMISLLGLGNNLLKYLKVIVVVQLRPVHFEANLAVLKILNNLDTLGQRIKNMRGPLSKPSSQTLDWIFLWIADLRSSFGSGSVLVRKLFTPAAQN